MKKVTLIAVIVLVAMLSATLVGAQVSYSDSAYTSYQVVNLGASPADIIVTYYNPSGVAQGYQPTFSSVPAGGAVTVQQALEGSLASGQYSAVISSNQPIAAIGNQQLGTVGSGSSIAPFSSYTGASMGAGSVILPVVMHNWFGYYTEVYIQNVGPAAANVEIAYAPTSLSGCTTGEPGQTDAVAALAPYASAKVSQFGKTALGAVPACGGFQGRFLGSATVTADQPIVVVVNQVVNNKLFTYNGFTAADASTTLLAPAYMRNFFGYYASISIMNPGATDAAITVEYAGSSASLPANTTISANHTVPAGKSITIYDGPGSTSDLSPTFSRFFGSVKITSDVPVVAMVNQESTAAAGNQAGSYNAFSAATGTAKISVPLIQSAFYGYYTSLTIQTVDGTDATVKITYTSDGTYSSVKNFSKAYTMSTAGGFLNRYEGSTASAAQSDILDDADWKSGGVGRFLGSAVIEVTSGANIVAFVNSESGTAPNATTRDSLYSYNAFNLEP